MLIFLLDDEPKALKNLHNAVLTADSYAEVVDYSDVDNMLSSIKNRNLKPDVVFMDIELRGENGILVATKIKTAAPEAKIVFVTGFAQYAVDAYRIHANGYIIKPAAPERIREELNCLDLPKIREEAKEKLCVKCFGNFEVFWHGEPLLFKRSKSKELFAYLVDREGAFCTGGEIVSALWEDGTEIKSPRNYLRLLTYDLCETFESVGMKNVIVRERNKWAVRKELLDCDYYRMLSGDVEAINEYRGEYMTQYSWAELTAGKLFFEYNS